MNAIRLQNIDALHLLWLLPVLAAFSTTRRMSSGAMSSRVTIHLDDGEAIELDTPSMPGSSSDFNAPLIDLLAG